MSYSVELLKRAGKDFSRLVENNKKAWQLLTEAVQNLENLESNKALNEQSIKILSGINKKTKGWLEKQGFPPALFKYRGFSKNFPVKIIFAVSEEQKRILVIEALHHKDMNQSKFMKSLSKRVKDI